MNNKPSFMDIPHSLYFASILDEATGLFIGFKIINNKIEVVCNHEISESAQAFCDHVVSVMEEEGLTEKTINTYRAQYVKDSLN